MGTLGGELGQGSILGEPTACNYSAEGVHNDVLGGGLGVGGEGVIGGLGDELGQLVQVIAHVSLRSRGVSAR